MHRLLFLPLLFALATGLAHAQTKATKPAPKKPVTKVASPAVALPAAKTNAIVPENTERFFSDFRNKSELPERSEFETKEEYAKRLPAPWDTAKVVYFVADNDEQGKNYKYDIDSGILTVLGGDIVGASGGIVALEKPLMGQPIAIKTVYGGGDSYEAENAFGKKVTVKRTQVTYYTLFINNTTYFTKNVFGNGEISVEMSKPPKIAQALSKQLEMLIGVRLKGYDNAAYECTHQSKPTIDNPSDFAVFVRAAEADLVKIIVRNKTTKEVLMTVEPQKSEPTNGQGAIGAPLQ